MKRISIIILFLIALTIIITYVIYNIYIRRDISEVSEEKINQKEKIISEDLRIGITNFDTLNPILSNNTNVQNISRLIFEPLLSLTYDYRLEECLSTEWTKTNYNTYLIRLRKDIKWHDGKKFDSNDVIYTIDSIKKLKEKSIYYYNVENIKEIKKIDEYTIKIITTGEIPYFEYNLIFPILSSKEDKNTIPSGTGMYYIEERKNEKIELKINTDWWQKKEIRLNNINISLYKDINDEINDIELNKIDLFNTSVNDIDKYMNTTKYNKKLFISRNHSYLAINCNKKVLKNKKIRQAINYGINKNEIIEKIYNNNYIKSEFPLDFGCYIYKDNSEITRYNLNKAKEIIQENKIKNINLKLLINNKEKDKIEVSKIIKEQLNKIGIIINIIEKDEKEYEKEIENNNFDIALIDNTYSFSPTLTSYFNEDNLSCYNNVRIEKILKKIEKFSEEEAKKSIQDIKEIYDKEVPFISLFYDTNTLVYSKNLKGKIFPNSYSIFYNIENWYMEYDK